jgi:hypothetical protein
MALNSFIFVYSLSFAFTGLLTDLLTDPLADGLVLERNPLCLITQWPEKDLKWCRSGNS